MTPSLLYYISGHGFGHARRCAETIRLLKQRHPELPIQIRTMASAHVFTGIDAHYEQVGIDRGAVEIDALNINWPATIDNVRELLVGKDALIAREMRYIQDNHICLIIADVPFMAGYVAHAAGVPCYAQCNFMWDWIYEPHTEDQELLEAIRTGYRLMAGQLRLPFPHPCNHFRQVFDVPFITSPLKMGRTQVEAALGLAADDRRPRVLIGMRGGTDAAILERLKHIESDYLFLTLAGPTGRPHTHDGSTPLPFWDVMQICDAVISKPGHGIVTDCATLGVALLHPPRNGFREDPMILREGSQYFRQLEIPLEDYQSGNWKPHLDRLLTQPKPHPATNTNGREWVAGFVEKQLTLSARS